MDKAATMRVPGSVLTVRGSVVEVGFDDHLPPIHTLLRAGDDGGIALEVQVHSGARSVRAIALTPTQGLARGVPVRDTGGPLMAPVGKGILLRMFDVFGNAIERQPVPQDISWRSVHRAPPALAQEIRRTLAQYAELKDIIAMLGLEQLSPEDRNIVGRARRLERFLTQPFFTTEQFTGLKGKLVSLADALDGCERILRDEFKDYPESALYMIGKIDEAQAAPSAAPRPADGGAGHAP